MPPSLPAWAYPAPRVDRFLTQNEAEIETEKFCPSCLYEITQTCEYPSELCDHGIIIHNKYTAGYILRLVAFIKAHDWPIPAEDLADNLQFQVITHMVCITSLKSLGTDFIENEGTMTPILVGNECDCPWLTEIKDICIEYFLNCTHDDDAVLGWEQRLDLIELDPWVRGEQDRINAENQSE